MNFQTVIPDLNVIFNHSVSGASWPPIGFSYAASERFAAAR